MSGSSSRLILRQMAGVQGTGLTVIDAVAAPLPRLEEGLPAGTDRRVTLYFAPGTDPSQVMAGSEPQEGVLLFSLGGALCMRIDQPQEIALREPVPLPLNAGDGASLRVLPDPAEPEFLAGRDVAVAIRNGESPETVLTWLRYHAERQKMTGAVIVDQAAPGTDPGFAEALKTGIDRIGTDLHVILLRSALPLGRAGVPPESHPYCAPDAPGKDRMEIPAADPFAAPLGISSIYEIVRMRFLSRAAAVANIDVHDLLLDDPDGTVFERARKSQNGILPLVGRHAYPWRVRPGEPPRFADHICVQFDTGSGRVRWCVVPAKLPDTAFMRLRRIGGVTAEPQRPAIFARCMNLRHPVDSVSLIVPKSSLVEDKRLLALSEEVFGYSPVRMPEIDIGKESQTRGRVAVVTTMKNEGPFILEWIAYHRSIGVDDFLIYTNDCTDGTDELLDLLQKRGIVQHRDNPFRKSGLKPQHAALHAADSEPMIRKAQWVACIDVDEFINIKTGDGTLNALFAALPDANLIAMNWRLFGNDDVHEFRDDFVTEQFLRSAPELIRKPHQAWGFKTLFKNLGIFKKLGVHRPKGLNPQLWDQIRWVNGSGKPLPMKMYRNAWRSTPSTYGYDLVQLNHYAVRSAESFLVKRDRGRVNHVDRDQGLAYWFRMNNNAEEEHSILSRIPRAREEFDRLLSDPEIAAAHATAVARHRAKIDELRATGNYAAFYTDLTGPRLENLSRLHSHFGANVFLSGPDVIPPEIAEKSPNEDFFFTVEQGETIH